MSDDISGTPSVADLGINPIKLEIHHRTTHFMHLHCTQAFLEFEFNVIECDIVLSGNVTDAQCPDSFDGAIDLIVTSSNTVGLYVWDNGATTEDLSGISMGTYNVMVVETNGCEAEATFDVGGTDSTPPSAQRKDVDVNLDATGNLTIDASVIDDVSSDVCGLASQTLDITDFDCTDAYDQLQNGTTTTVTMTIEDNNGNVSSCQSVVTVLFDVTDSDCDGVGDACDVCAVGDDSYDNNGDGIPDCSQLLSYNDYPADWKCSNNKIYICHNGNNPHTICINKNALPAHMAHVDDSVGPCQSCSSNAPSNAADLIALEQLGTYHSHDSESTELKIYPNPASNEITFLIEHIESAIEFSIYDVSGRVVMSQSIIDGNSKFEMTAEELGITQGIYFVFLQGDNVDIRKKLVIVD